MTAQHCEWEGGGGGSTRVEEGAGPAPSIRKDVAGEAGTPCAWLAKAKAGPSRALTRAARVRFPPLPACVRACARARVRACVRACVRAGVRARVPRGFRSCPGWGMTFAFALSLCTAPLPDDSDPRAERVLKRAGRGGGGRLGSA